MTFQSYSEHLLRYADLGFSLDLSRMDIPAEYYTGMEESGESVNLAARICAHASGKQTLASGTVKDLAIGKDIQFTDQGAIALKGFPDPVPLFEVGWAGA